MIRKIKGIALLLFSILLTLGFDAMGWTWFDLLPVEIKEG